MDIYMMQYNYRSRYLIVINKNTHVSVYKYEKDKFDPAFLSLQVKKFFFAKSKICEMTEFSGAMDNTNFKGSTI